MDIGTFPLIFQCSARLIRYGYKHNVAWIMNLVTQRLRDSLLGAVPTHYLTRISAAQAQAVVDKWPEVDEDARHRIACAQIYYAALKDIPGVICPAPPGDRSNTFLYFPVQVADKYALQRYMIEQGCDVAVQHAANCADLPAYKDYYRDCPAARAAYAGTVTLPVYRGFPLAQAQRYAQTIRAYFGA